MKCNICGQECVIYKAQDGKAINLVVFENATYCYCVRCLRKELLQRLYALKHPTYLKELGATTADLIHAAEADLREVKKFDDVV
jgi:hypothetical protein